MDEMSLRFVRESVAFAALIIGGSQQGAALVFRTIGMRQNTGGLVQGDDARRVVLQNNHAWA